MWFDLNDLTIVSEVLGVIEAIDPKTKRAHTFARNRRHERQRSQTPKPETVLVVAKDSEFWKYVPPQAVVDDAEVAKLIDTILKDWR
jgi:hypothetical protein